MRTKFAILVGAGVLSLAVGLDGANAAVRYYHRHAMRSAHIPAATTQAPVTDYSTLGNNPAKRYPTRHMPEGAITTATLPQLGNNPAKRYPVRHASEYAVREATLSTTGNNPVKRYPASVH